MKKLILVSLCALFVGSTSVFGAYAVSGVVTDESGSTVDGATVYINCYPAAGGSYSNTVTSGPAGGPAGAYAGGWLNHNCNGEKMVVKAVKGNKSGTVSWTAGGVVDVKNVKISAPPPLVPYLELHCEATPMTMSQANVATISPVNLYVQMAYVGPIMVNGGTTTMHYETETMSCSSVAPRPPFYFTSLPVIDPIGGTITVTVEASVPGGVPVYNGEHVTSFFDVFFTARDVNAPKISTVTVTSQIYTQSNGQISAFPSRTDNLIGTPHTSSGHLLIDSEEEWLESISSGHVRPLLADEWTVYMSQWSLYKEEGQQYPTNTFKPASLAVYGGGGGGGGGCEDAGLVMMWGGTDPTLPSGSYSSAWEYDYLLDPDLSNSTITVTVTPKQFGVGGNQVNAVSFGIKDINGNIRSWWWNCPIPLAWNVPTKITIDTSKVGIAAANPVATGFANNPAFNIKQSQFFTVDENFNWVFGQMQVPPPGQQQLGVMWNYWHNLIVTPNTSPYKGSFVKWSQKPVVNADGTINGWDEFSSYDLKPIIADDWECKDARPVTDIHWWGSFINWTQPKLPPVLPAHFISAFGQMFQMGRILSIRSVIPERWFGKISVTHGFGTLPVLIRTHKAGLNARMRHASSSISFYRRINGSIRNPTAQMEKRVYWLSISAIYPSQTTMQYPFGWKTRPHFFNDDATRIGMVMDPTGLNIWPPVIGSQWANGMPIEFPAGVSWDMAFELTTNEEGTPSADLNHDGIVNFIDFAIFANQWLTAGP